jgi:hypothetical protein
MRIYFVLAVADGKASAVLGKIKQMSVDSSRRLQYGNDKFLVKQVAKSADIGPVSSGDDGRWDVYLLTSISDDWRHGARFFRMLGRESLGNPGWLLGPFSVARFREMKPAIAKALFDDKSQPARHVVFGDSWESDVEGVDYRPSSADCIADVEIKP